MSVSKDDLYMGGVASMRASDWTARQIRVAQAMYKFDVCVPPQMADEGQRLSARMFDLNGDALQLMHNSDPKSFELVANMMQVMTEAVAGDIVSGTAFSVDDINEVGSHYRKMLGVRIKQKDQFVIKTPMGVGDHMLFISGWDVMDRTWLVIWFGLAWNSMVYLACSLSQQACGAAMATAEGANSGLMSYIHVMPSLAHGMAAVTSLVKGDTAASWVKAVGDIAAHDRAIAANEHTAAQCTGAVYALDRFAFVSMSGAVIQCVLYLLVAGYGDRILGALIGQDLRVAPPLETVNIQPRTGTPDDGRGNQISLVPRQRRRPAPLLVRPPGGGGNQPRLMPPSSDSTDASMCLMCGIGIAVSQCSQCKIAAYCSEGCQADHWKDGHSDVCRAQRFYE